MRETGQRQGGAVRSGQDSYFGTVTVDVFDMLLSLPSTVRAVAKYVYWLPGLTFWSMKDVVGVWATRVLFANAVAVTVGPSTR
jgi:hypothetical protein